MLNKIRSLTQGLVAKIIIGFIIMTFAVWGIGDIFRSSSVQNIITMGDLEISPQQFDYETSRTKEIIRNNYPDLNNDELSNLPVKSLTIKRLVRDNLSIMENESLNFRVHEKDVMDNILSNRNFQEIDGRFSKTKFEQILLANGIAETSYIDQTKNKLTARILDSNFANLDITFPNLAKLQYEYLNEERVIDIISVTGINSNTKSKSPSDAELIDFYEQNENLFLFPESRDLEFLDVSCKAMKKHVDITDEDINYEYQTNIDAYREPEKRYVLQIFSKEKTKVEKAYQNLIHGKKFLDVAKDLDIDPKDLSLGTVEKKNLLANFQDTVFSLKEKSFSTVTKGPFGWHLFYIEHIISGEADNFAGVRKQIKNALLEKKSCAKAFEVFNKIETEVDSDKSLRDIAKQFRLNLQVFTGLSSNDYSSISSIIDKHPIKAPKIVAQIFSYNEIGVNTSVALDEETYFAFNLKSIKPKRTHTLDEVKGLAIELWQEEKYKEMVLDYTESLLKKMKKNKVSASSLKQNPNIKVERKVKIHRSSFERAPDFMNEIFELEGNNFSKIHEVKSTRSGYQFAKLLSVRQKTLSEKDKDLLLKNIIASTTRHVEDTLFEQYMSYLFKKYNVKIISNISDAK